jgi:hypothetical protein
MEFNAMDLLMLWDVVKLSEQFSKLIISSMHPRGCFGSSSGRKLQKRKRAPPTEKKKPAKPKVLEALAAFREEKKDRTVKREAREPLQHEVKSETSEPLQHEVKTDTSDSVPEEGDKGENLEGWRKCCPDGCICTHIRCSGAVTYQSSAWEALAAEAPPRWPRATVIYHGDKATYKPKTSSPLKWEYRLPSEEWSEWERMMEVAFDDEDE